MWYVERVSTVSFLDAGVVCIPLQDFAIFGNHFILELMSRKVYA